MSNILEAYNNMIEKNNALSLDWFRKTYAGLPEVYCVGDGKLYDLSTIKPTDIKLSMTIEKAIVAVKQISIFEREVCILRSDGIIAKIGKYDEVPSDSILSRLRKNSFAKAKVEANGEANIQAKPKQYPCPEDEPKQNSVQGIKDTKGKSPVELDFNFLKAISGRMTKNKSKYPPYNWHKPIPKTELEEACKRHFLEVFSGNLEDDGEPLGGIEALVCDLMMLWYQHKHYPEQKTESYSFQMVDVGDLPMQINPHHES